MRKETFVWLLVGMVLLEIVMFGAFPMRANPFLGTEISGRVVSVDADQQTGIVETSSALVLVKLDARYLGPQFVRGCYISARGAYHERALGTRLIFVITTMEQICPRPSKKFM